MINKVQGGEKKRESERERANWQHKKRYAAIAKPQQLALVMQFLFCETNEKVRKTK